MGLSPRQPVYRTSYQQSPSGTELPWQLGRRNRLSLMILVQTGSLRVHAGDKKVKSQAQKQSTGDEPPPPVKLAADYSGQRFGTAQPPEGQQCFSTLHQDDPSIDIRGHRLSSNSEVRALTRILSYKPTPHVSFCETDSASAKLFPSVLLLQRESLFCLVAPFLGKHRSGYPIRPSCE